MLLYVHDALLGLWYIMSFSCRFTLWSAFEPNREKALYKSLLLLYINALHRLSARDWGIKQRTLDSSLVRADIFLQSLLTCCSNVKWLSNIRPRYLMSLTCCHGDPLSDNWSWWSQCRDLWLQNKKTLVFVQFTLNLFTLNQVFRRSRSDCRLFDTSTGFVLT